MRLKMKEPARAEAAGSEVMDRVQADQVSDSAVEAATPRTALDETWVPLNEALAAVLMKMGGRA